MSFINTFRFNDLRTSVLYLYIGWYKMRWKNVTYVYAHQLNAWENSEIMWDECIIYFNMLWFSSYTNLCFIPEKRYGVYLFAEGINSFLRKVQWTISWELVVPEVWTNNL